LRSGAAGAARRPNNCADLSCEDDGNEQGSCHGGPAEQDLFCTGFVRKGGGGIITCSNQR
jgi:hypothetical protein